MDGVNLNWDFENSQVLDYGVGGGAGRMLRNDDLLDDVNAVLASQTSNPVLPGDDDDDEFQISDLGDLSQLSDLNLSGLADFSLAKHGLRNDENLGLQLPLNNSGIAGFVPLYQVNPGPSYAAKSKMLQQERPVVPVESVMFPDREIITTEDWAGPYNFMVTPEANSKKAMFDPELNKLFANIHTSVPFRIEMAFEKMAILKDFTIRANLIFLDDDLRDRPVVRCYKHVGEEENITDADKKARIQHILRPSAEGEARYVQNDVSKRCYLSLPVKLPEAGVNYTMQNFNFACLNSCATIPSVTSAAKRDLGILFVLWGQVDGKLRALGRRFIKLRVCSAPARDYGKEKQGGQGRKRASNDQLHGEPKRASLDREQDGNDGIELVSPRVQAHSSVRCVLTGPIPPAAEETVSSSQESLYSSCDTDSRIPFRKLVQEMQWTLKQKNSANPILQEYSGHVFGALRMIQGLCQSARKFELQTVKEECEKSPDAGFEDHHGQD